MAQPVEVREARLSDAPEVVRLLAQLGHAQPPGTDAERLERFLQDGQHVLVATRNTAAPGGALLGAVTLHVTTVLHRPGPIGRMTAVIVDETARGGGVGRALVEAAERFLAARGCVSVELTSNKRRSAAHAFYETLGYAQTSYRFVKPL